VYNLCAEVEVVVGVRGGVSVCMSVSLDLVFSFFRSVLIECSVIFVSVIRVWRDEREGEMINNTNLMCCQTHNSHSPCTKSLSKP
jgi:hypothetical protein